MTALPTFTFARWLVAFTFASLVAAPFAGSVYGWHSGAGCLSAAGAFVIMCWSEVKSVRRTRATIHREAKERGTQALRHVLDRGDSVIEYDPPTVGDLVGGWEASS